MYIYIHKHTHTHILCGCEHTYVCVRMHLHNLSDSGRSCIVELTQLLHFLNVYELHSIIMTPPLLSEGWGWPDAILQSWGRLGELDRDGGWVGVGGLILSRNLYMFPTYREIIIYKDNGESWVCTKNANLIANNR